MGINIEGGQNKGVGIEEGNKKKNPPKIPL